VVEQSLRAGHTAHPHRPRDGVRNMDSKSVLLPEDQTFSPTLPIYNATETIREGKEKKEVFIAFQ